MVNIKMNIRINKIQDMLISSNILDFERPKGKVGRELTCYHWNDIQILVYDGLNSLRNNSSLIMAD